MHVTPLAEREAAPAPAHASCPAPLVVRLPRSRALRVRTVIGALILGPMALGISVAFLLMTVASPTVAGQIFGAIFGPACTAATIWWLRSRLRMALGTGRLTIDDHRIRIEDHALLRGPIVIERSQLRSAALGGLDPEVDIGWVPAIVDADQVPNLTVLFTEPLPAPRPRQRWENLPPPKAALTALSLHVEDPAAVAGALSDWNALRPLHPDDAALHVASARRGPLRRAVLSRSERRGWLLVAGGIVIPVFGFLAIADASVLWQTRRTRAVVLAVAGFTIGAVRIAAALTMDFGSPTCGM